MTYYGYIEPYFGTALRPRAEEQLGADQQGALPHAAQTRALGVSPRPRPSSRMRSSTPQGLLRKESSSRDARAWRTVLVSASCAIR